MFSAINTKLLIAILAAITAIGALVVKQQHNSARAAEQAAKAAAILQRQELERKAQEDAQKREYQEMLNTIEREHKKHANDNKHASKTWTTYVP